MRLNYSLPLPDDKNPLVLLGANAARVEIHMRQEANGVTTLFAFAGCDQIERKCAQGPYETRDQALAARKAIFAELVRTGFELAQSELPLWSLAAQREIKQMRVEKSQSTVDTRFDPKDVFLDW